VLNIDFRLVRCLTLGFFFPLFFFFPVFSGIVLKDRRQQSEHEKPRRIEFKHGRLHSQCPTQPVPSQGSPNHSAANGRLHVLNGEDSMQRNAIALVTVADLTSTACRGYG
jgi:hypothetical protein